MRHNSLLAMLVLPATLALVTAGRAAGPTAQRDWLTADGSTKVRIGPCGQHLCGTIVWLKEPLDPASRQPRQDNHNPERSLRGRPLLGLRVIVGLTPASGGWAGGTIYDPNTGRTYASRLSSTADGGLKVEGCLAVFCQSRIWTPAK